MNDEVIAPIGVISEVNGYTIKVIINKDEAPNPIYPINTPMPIYCTDSNENLLVIYQQELLAPASDLPSLNILEESGIIVLDPAKNFILKSALSSFQGSAVLISEMGVLHLLADIFTLSEDQLLKCWKEKGFNHLKLVAELLGSERFKIFMRVFSELFLDIILEQPSIKTQLSTILVEIGDKRNLNEDSDYLSILDSFMRKDCVALVLDNSMSEVKVLVSDDSLNYGDLICFEEEKRLTLTVIREIGPVSILDPLFAIEDGTPTTFVKPLKFGMEGTTSGVDKILSELNKKFDNSFIKIPIADIPNTNQIYNIYLKGNELLHFAIIAISSKGKGNVLKQMIFESQLQLIKFLESGGNFNKWNRLGMILFDDVGEYVRCLKPRDWGMNLAMLVMGYLHENRPKIHLVDITGRIEKNEEIEEDFQFNAIKKMKIPIEFIPLKEVLRKIEGYAAEGLLISYLRHYYRVESPDSHPEGFNENRLTLEFINWFLSEGTFAIVNNGRDQFGYNSQSYETARRELTTFLLNNQHYLGIFLNREQRFQYSLDQKDNPITKEIKNRKGEVIRTSLHEDYNLLSLSEDCSDKGEVLIIDESSLDPRVKLLVQRIILNHIVELREQRGFDPNIVPCLFIIEEATALIRGKETSQIELFLQMQVRARKFGIGIGLVLQDIKNVDRSLLTQLGWMIALGLPVDSMRGVLFKNVPADLGSYDDYVKYADVGMAVGFQMLLGSNLPLPIKVRHFEKSVKDLFWSEEIWGKKGVKEEDIKKFKEIATSLGIPKEVLDEILKKPEGK